MVWILVIGITGLLMLTLFSPGSAGPSGISEREKGKIEALIVHVEKQSDVVFIRNGVEYDSKRAARFLRGKWGMKSDEITTAEDFIRKVASFSTETGKPYLMRFGDGRVVALGRYLMEILERLRI